VAVASTGGYWILLADGTIAARGVASLGQPSTIPVQPGEHWTAIVADPARTGYWTFTDRGRAAAFGTAGDFGDLVSSGVDPVGGVVGAAVTASGRGYFMIGSDGGVFTFGDAAFRGSMGDRALNAPVVGIAADSDGDGYWLVAADGGVFAFDAAFRGSMGGQPLSRPVIGALAYGGGYLMVASDGGVFDFSPLPFLGSLGANPPPRSIVGVAARLH
jgi:hypothetical protein